MRPRTKQEFVYQTLRSAIMRCDIAPGERLVIDDLARKLEVSIIPVREALQLLQSEGLIVNVPHVGATVAPITRESILDVFTLLEGLETMATRLVAERGDPAELQLLGSYVKEMDNDAEAGRLEHWAELNTRFHLEIGAMPGLRMLHETTARVLDNWHRVRRFFFRGVLQLRVTQAQQEHREMLAAMRARDFGALADVVSRHNRNALAAYLGFLDQASGLPAAEAAEEVPS
jgi:DNA-binding GntR family transcriptional regulator